MTLETSTLRACMEYLKLRRIAAWRINTIGVPIAGAPGKFRPSPSRGVSDIIAVHHGKPIAIEVKSERGQQSRQQMEFEDKWRAAGGHYLMVRSVGELKDYFEPR